MATPQNLEELMENQVEKIAELEMATVFIQNKEGMKDDLLEAQQDLDEVKKGFPCLREQLDQMKEQNVKMRELITLYKDLDKRIIHMSENIPESLLLHLENSESKNYKMPKNEVPQSENKYSNHLPVENIENDLPMEIKDCKKALFREVEDAYCILPLTEDEFIKIPKYMIGRQTLETVNSFVGTINQIMKAKYGLLALGKAGARKKGELDLYMHFKKEETDAKEKSTEKTYFFTAEDYQREIKIKLDKAKLNLLTVLRHCKRLHEIRNGKNVKYQVITHG